MKNHTARVVGNRTIRTSMAIDQNNKPPLSTWFYNGKSLLDIYNQTYGLNFKPGSRDDWELGQEIEIITDEDIN